METRNYELQVQMIDEENMHVQLIHRRPRLSPEQAEGIRAQIQTALFSIRQKYTI